MFRRKKQKAKKEPRMSKRERELMRQFDMGRVLYVDEDVDNKQLLIMLDEENKDEE